jgi:Mn2+/Fe2+ NRAMP family transporter
MVRNFLEISLTFSQKFTSSKLKMGTFANPIWVIGFLGILVSIVTVANSYLIYETLYGSAGVIVSLKSYAGKVMATVVS